MHPEAYQYVAGVVRDHNLKGAVSVLEIGSYNVNGTIRGLFDTHDYVGIDVRPGPGVDVVADGATYTHAHTFDVVVCCETLEHAPNAAEIVYNACLHVAPGGTLIITAAGIERAPHGCNGGEVGGEFYRGVSHEMLTDWLSAHPSCWPSVSTNAAAGDIYATATVR